MVKSITKEVGMVSVDSGTILIGDPCYWMNDDDYEKEVVSPRFDQSRQIYHDLGHVGKGVISSSGYGDGCYPVYAKIKDGRVKEIRVVFF